MSPEVPQVAITKCLLISSSLGYDSVMIEFAITSAAITGVALTAAYQATAPTASWYGSSFIGSGRARKQLALTYDDGPNDPYTQQLLEVLEKHNVKATFFLIGRYVRQRPDVVQEIVRAGHTIGNHTFTHPLLTFKAKADMRREFADCRSALSEAIGAHSNLFRPPFGGRRPAVLKTVRELGMQPVMWSVTGFDWGTPGVAAIEKQVSSHTRGGDVILLHDGGHKEMGTDRSQTVAATDNLLRRYRDEGYDFVTIPEMMRTA